MIVKGVSLETLVEATAATQTGVLAKFKAVPGGAQGYFKATYADKAYRATVSATGLPHKWEPCACFYKKLRTELEKLGSCHWTITLHKHKLNYGNIGYKSKLALTKNGLVCAHEGASKPEPATSPAASHKPTASVTPSGKLLEFPMLDGDPLEPGDGPVSVAALKSKARNVYVATTSLYVLEECKIAALRVPSAICSEIPDHLLMRACQAVQWRNRVVRYAEHFAHTLARNFFDFLVMASYGEARYGQGGKYTFDDASMKLGRSSAYQSAMKYDPRDLIPKLVYVFNDYKWGSAFGGKKWGHIAETAGLYFKPEFRSVPIAFVDHCVDLAHNGGLAFNKGYLLTNPSDQYAYMKMLDEKRNGSLLDSKTAHPISPEVAELLATGVSLGLVRRPRAEFRIEPDVPQPILTWGMEKVKLYDGAGCITASAPKESEQHVETYPER